MLYFTRWKALAIILTALVVCLCAVPNFFPEATGQDLAGLGAAATWCSGSICRAARTFCSRSIPTTSRKRSSTRSATTCAGRCATPRIGYTGLAVRGRQRRGPHRKDTRPAERAGQAARAVAAARRFARLQRPAQPRSHRCRRRADPADGSAGGDHRPHPADRSSSRSRSSRRRVNELGTVEPLIQRQGTDRILVQVPGLQDPTRLKELLGKTAKMEFRMVDPTVPPDQAAAGQGAAGFRSADEPQARRRRPMSSRSRCWSPAAI